MFFPLVILFLKHAAYCTDILCLYCFCPRKYWGLIKESNLIYVISCHGVWYHLDQFFVIHYISCCYCTQCCMFSSWISHFVVRLFLVISRSCFNKIQQCIWHFLFTCYIHNALYVSSTKYDFPSLDVFAISWFFFSVSVYNLLHFYQSSSHFFYLIPYFRFVSWHGVDDVL